MQAVSWNEAFQAIAEATNGVPGAAVAAIAGDLADCESMLALKDLMTALGSNNIDCRQDGSKLDARVRCSYLFNTSIAGIERAEALVLVGCNPRLEAPVLNARIRKRWAAGNFNVGVIGPKADLTYPTVPAGTSAKDLEAMASGQGDFAKVLKKAKRAMIILGQGALMGEDGAAVLNLARQAADKLGMIKSGWNGFNVLHTAAARVGGLDLGFVPGEGGRDVAGILAGTQSSSIKIVYLLGADEIDTQALGEAFVIYQGHHGDAGAHRADVILPGAAYTEKNATYVNTEGRVQLGRRAIFPPGEAREDWTIIRALSAVLGQTLPYDDLKAVRTKLVEANANFLKIDQTTPADWASFGAEGAVSDAPFNNPVHNFYMTDPISRASETMAHCIEVFGIGDEKKTGTDG